MPVRDGDREQTLPVLVGDPDLDEGMGRAAIESRLPKPKPHRFTLLLFDTELGAVAKVNFSNIWGGLEEIMRASPVLRTSPQVGGIVVEVLLEAAQKMDPEFGPRRPRPRTAPEKPRREFDPRSDIEQEANMYDARGRFIPRWRRRRGDGQGLAEYALILVLIAIVAVIALLFIGSQVSEALSNIGNSI